MALAESTEVACEALASFPMYGVSKESIRPSRFHSAELETEGGAEEYLQREWSGDPIADRYDWLYKYDVLTTEV